LSKFPLTVKLSCVIVFQSAGSLNKAPRRARRLFDWHSSPLLLDVCSTPMNRQVAINDDGPQYAGRRQVQLLT
jgi:hypothetical protein